MTTDYTQEAVRLVARAITLVARDIVVRLIPEEVEDKEFDAMCTSIAEQAFKDIVASPCIRDLVRLRLKALAAECIAEKCTREVDRRQAEADHHRKWAEAERAKGRPENELTWGNCVRETGIWPPN